MNLAAEWRSTVAALLGSWPVSSVRTSVRGGVSGRSNSRMRSLHGRRVSGLLRAYPVWRRRAPRVAIEQVHAVLSVSFGGRSTRAATSVLSRRASSVDTPSTVWMTRGTEISNLASPRGEIEPEVWARGPWVSSPSGAGGGRSGSSPRTGSPHSALTFDLRRACDQKHEGRVAGGSELSHAPTLTRPGAPGITAFGSARPSLLRGRRGPRFRDASVDSSASG